MNENRQYLGDAVYVDWDGYSVVLTTEDGVSVANTIYLEPAVYNALVRWHDRMLAPKEAPDE